MPPSRPSGMSMMAAGVGSSALRERLQNFMPQIKKANEEIAQRQEESATSSVRIDEDLFVLANENDDDNDSDSDESIGLAEAGTAASKAVVPAKPIKDSASGPSVEIKLSFGEVNADLLTALGEKVDSDVNNNHDHGVPTDTQPSSAIMTGTSSVDKPEIILPGVGAASSHEGFSMNAVSSKRISRPNRQDSL